MPRRSRDEMENEDDYEEVSTPEEVQANTTADDEVLRDQVGLDNVVNQVIRIVLGKDMKTQVFKREHIPSELNIRAIGFDKVIQEVNRRLKLIYGLSLEELDAPKESTKKRSKQQFAIVSSLTSEDRLFLGELWSNSVDTVYNDKTVSDTQYFLPSHKQSATPGTNTAMVKLGVMFLVISCIIVSENHISETELFETLKSFGISKNVNIRNSNYGMNLTELINEFVKSDYITKEIIKGNTESENTFTFSLGKRSLLELSPQDVYNYIKIIWGKKFDQVEAGKTIITIERVYQVSLKNEFEENITSSNNEENEAINQEGNNA